jgi:broad specificity phosphatase PhoE
MGDLQGRAWEKDRGQIVKKRKEDIVEPESPQSVKERAVKWWNETILGTTTASYVLVVSHGAWIRMLVQGLLEDKSIRAGLGVTVGRCLNTGVSIVSIPRAEKGRGELLQYGNIAHLREVDVDTHVVEENGDEKGMDAVSPAKGSRSRSQDSERLRPAP